jgi:hypothetical protein
MQEPLEALDYLSPVTNQRFYSLDTWSDLDIVVPQLSLTTATGWFADAHLGNRPQIPELGIAKDLHLSMRSGIGPGKLDFLLYIKHREPLGNTFLGLKISNPCKYLRLSEVYRGNKSDDSKSVFSLLSMVAKL